MEYFDYTEDKWIYNDGMKIVIIGGTGGIGQKLSPILAREYEVLSVGSKTANLCHFKELKDFMYVADPDVLINLAGYNSNSFLHKVKSDEAAKQIAININGTINLMRATLPIMRDKGFGRIILTSSVLIKKPVIGTSIYTGCKGFIEALVKQASMENAMDVTINALRLGYMDAGLTYLIPENIREEIRKNIPGYTFGSVQNIANAVKMIIDSNYINGTAIEITSGL